MKFINLKADNDMIQEAVHRSPSICLTAEENSGKPQLKDRLTKALRPVIASNRDSYLQMRSVGFLRTSGREKKDKKEETGRD